MADLGASGPLSPRTSPRLLNYLHALIPTNILPQHRPPMMLALIVHVWRSFSFEERTQRASSGRLLHDSAFSSFYFSFAYPRGYIRACARSIDTAAIFTHLVNVPQTSQIYASVRPKARRTITQAIGERLRIHKGVGCRRARHSTVSHD